MYFGICASREHRIIKCKLADANNYHDLELWLDVTKNLVKT